MSCSLPIGASDVSAEEEWAAEVAVVKEEAVREDLVVEEAAVSAVVVAAVSAEVECKVSDHALSHSQYLYATPIVA